MSLPEQLTIEKILASSDSRSRRRTKIVATVGPNSRDAETLEKLIKAGVNVFRLNFSHGTPDQHLSVINLVRMLSSKLDYPVAILQDLPGPKLRISAIENDVVELREGDPISIIQGTKLSDSSKLYVEAIDASKFAQPGQRVLLADGLISLRVNNVQGNEVRCTVANTMPLRANVGIAFPDSDYELPAVTCLDQDYIRWGVKHNVDFIALSFVNSAEDIRIARKIITEEKGTQQIVSKIERRSALLNIEEILKETDALMIARGDLGIELPLEKVPILQKILVSRANNMGCPVIVATQMLQSMVSSLTPTRAEAADVSLAVMNGADALMLSAESAIGKYPVESVRTLDRIAREAELRHPAREFRTQWRTRETMAVPDGIVFAACGAAMKTNASAIIACTETGNTARLCAKYRPMQPLYGVSSSETAIRRMCICWGVVPVYAPLTGNHEEELVAALKKVQRSEKLKNGSLAVITGGASVGAPGTTSILEVREMSFL